jgi:hypothetical protein
MEKVFNSFDFEHVNTEKKFSIITKLMALVIVIMFILIPLTDISPETFVLPKSILFSEGCGCLVPCN